jgi:hypothetical protein
MTAIRIAMVIALGCCIFTSIADAEPYDMTNCSAGETTMLVASKELVVFGYDIKGIVQDNLDTKAFANMTYRCVGYNQILAGKATGQGICKFMDKDGDYLVGEINSSGPEGTWKAYYGTGKWEGITGSGKYVYITNAKPIADGTFQNCNRSTGTYELPKKE